MFSISPAPAALAKRASKALSSAKLMFSRLRPPLGLDLSALSPPRLYAICARFTVLSEAPIASAIACCVIPPSRSSTIWMRWRRFGSPFQRSAVFNRRTWALVHLTISSPESDDQRESQAGALAKGSNLPDSRAKTSIQSAMEPVLDIVTPQIAAHQTNSELGLLRPQHVIARQEREEY